MIIRKIMVGIPITGWVVLSVWAIIVFFTGKPVNYFALFIIIINAMIIVIMIIFLITILWEDAEKIENSIKNKIKDKRAIKYSKQKYIKKQIKTGMLSVTKDDGMLSIKRDKS